MIIIFILIVNFLVRIDAIFVDESKHTKFKPKLDSQELHLLMVQTLQTFSRPPLSRVHENI